LVKQSQIFRVIAYIDGFNLYFGIKSKGWRDCYWLNLAELGRRLLIPSQSLAFTHYFTSRINSPDAKRKRQATYLEALATLPQFTTHFGHYLAKTLRCNACGATWIKHDEKMTDVNIATQLLTDAFTDQFDTALVISADSDLVGPVRRVHELFPTKRVVVAFPPDRFSATLQKVAYKILHIERHHLTASVFPDQIPKPGGFVLQRPKEWA
jgi:uncharacterized LabA/DUF88 family protein